MSTNTGGHAFPAMNDNGYWVGGMTLRDYFAAQAMQGDWATGNASSDGYETPEDAAKRYYKMADAMLKARGE